MLRFEALGAFLFAFTAWTWYATEFSPFPEYSLANLTTAAIVFAGAWIAGFHVLAALRYEITHR